MKHLLRATVGLLTLSVVPAMAADLPVKARPMVPIATAYNWTGCYIGGNVGGKWGQSTDSVTVAPAGIGAAGTVAFAQDRSSSFMAGGQVGCNYQPVGSNWVFGLEGDADWQRLRFSRTIVGATVFPFVAGDSFDMRSDWQASARARLGYAWDRWMIYATGGAAFTNVSVGANFIAIGIFPATVVSDSKTLVGWTVGGGLEYAVTNNWIAGIEGRYSNYGTTAYNAGLLATVNTGPGAFTFAPATQSVKLETFEVMGRLSYKFF